MSETAIVRNNHSRRDKLNIRGILDTLFYSLLLNIIILPILVIAINYILTDPIVQIPYEVNTVSELIFLLIIAAAFVIPFIVLYSIYCYESDDRSDMKKHIIVIKALIESLNYVIIVLYLSSISKLVSNVVQVKSNPNINLSMNWLMIHSYLTCYLIVYIVKTSIQKTKRWLFTESENDEIIKYKLSFINKVILGLLAIVSSIVSLILSLK